MKKRLWALCLAAVMALMIPGCAGQQNSAYGKYSYEFIGAFDTAIQFLGYSTSQEEFENMARMGQNRFMELHQLYDIYNDYEGINNIKTINDNAGIKPVEVQQEIIDLILFSKEWYTKTNGACNIALGPMLYIWHTYREAASANPDSAQIPSLPELQQAMVYTDMNKVIVDTDKKTVYLEDKNMRLDVGAVAKGYASEMVARELEAKGVNSLIISSGGNVRTIGQPLDGVRTKWGIGIQDPSGNPLDPQDEPLDIVFLANASVVTSGDYQRYYIVDGKRYHHLIDPKTLMPANYYRAVTVITEDSGVADFMSTTLFLTPYEEGRALAERLGVEAVWVLPDGTIQTTEKVKGMMKKLGGATGK